MTSSFSYQISKEALSLFRLSLSLWASLSQGGNASERSERGQQITDNRCAYSVHLRRRALPPVEGSRSPPSFSCLQSERDRIASARLVRCFCYGWQVLLFLHSTPTPRCILSGFCHKGNAMGLCVGEKVLCSTINEKYFQIM